MDQARSSDSIIELSDAEQQRTVGGSEQLVKWWDAVSGFLGVRLFAARISPVAL